MKTRTIVTMLIASSVVLGLLLVWGAKTASHQDGQTVTATVIAPTTAEVPAAVQPQSVIEKSNRPIIIVTGTVAGEFK